MWEFLCSRDLTIFLAGFNLAVIITINFRDQMKKYIIRMVNVVGIIPLILLVLAEYSLTRVITKIIRWHSKISVWANVKETK